MVLTIVALSLAVIALALAVWQTRDMIAIRNSISTRYIGRFPEFVGQIADLIDGAEGSLVIVCDVPGYCLFSNRKAWLEYERAIKKYRLKKRARLDLIFLDQERRLARMTEQLRAAVDDWQKWVKSERNVANLEILWHHLSPSDQLALLGQPVQVLDPKDIETDVRPPTYSRQQFPALARSISPSSFLKLLNQQHRAVLEDAFRGQPVKQVSVDLPVYYWVADDRRAIFSIPNISPQETEHAFVTNDQRLIRALLSMQERLSHQVGAGTPVKGTEAATE